MAKNRINELKLQNFNRRKEELIFEQTQKREECEQLHLDTYQDYNEKWDRELLNHQQNDAQKLDNLEEKHNVEYE